MTSPRGPKDGPVLQLIGLAKDAFDGELTAKERQGFNRLEQKLSERPTAEPRTASAKRERIKKTRAEK